MTVLHTGNHTIVRDELGPIVKCQVANCNTRARFKNPDTGLKYCINHHQKLGGRIIYETDPKTKHPIKWTKLVKLEDQ